MYYHYLDTAADQTYYHYLDTAADQITKRCEQPNVVNFLLLEHLPLRAASGRHSLEISISFANSLKAMLIIVA